MKILQEEHDKFIELSDKYKNEVDAEEVIYKKTREDDLAGFYRKFGRETFDIKLRVESDVSTENIVCADDLIGEVEVEAASDMSDISADDLIGE